MRITEAGDIYFMFIIQVPISIIEEFYDVSEDMDVIEISSIVDDSKDTKKCLKMLTRLYEYEDNRGG